MRGPVVRVLSITSGLLILGLAGSAQTYRYPAPRGEPYYDRYDRGPYGSPGPYGYGNGPAGVADRVVRDLYAASRGSFVDGHEREHFERAITELQRFQDRWARQGRFDTGHLDRAIGNLKHLAEARQVDWRVRRRLDQDIWALRDLRSQRDRYRR